MTLLLGRLIAWYAVWHAWKRRGPVRVPRGPFNIIADSPWPGGIGFYDVVDPAELRWGPGTDPPLPRFVTDASGLIVWSRP